MVHLIVMSAAESTQRRLLLEVTSRLRSQGLEIRQSGVGETWESLFSDALAQGLFFDRFARIVENAEELGPFPKDRLPFLEKNEGDALLILLYRGSPGKFLPKEVLAVSTVKGTEEIPYWPSQKISWLMAKARSKNLDLSQEGASVMAEFVEDGEELLSVLDTFVSCYGKGPVNLKMASDLVLNQGGRAMMNLLEGFSSRDPLGCVRAFSELREQDSKIIHPVLSALHKRVRYACYLKKFGTDTGWKKGLKMTDYQAKEAAKSSKLYGQRELVSLMAGLIRFSMAERSSFASGWAGLESLVLGVLAAPKP